MFITPNGYADWRATSNNNLWQGVAGINNPCPEGYRLPSSTELTAEVTAYSITNAATAFASPLKFTVPGGRNSFSAELGFVGSCGFYWSSSVSDSKATYRFFFSNGTMSFNDERAHGVSVRCIKEENNLSN